MLFTCKRYYKTIAKRAVKDTVSIIGFNFNTLLFAIFVAVISWLHLWQSKGIGRVKEEVGILLSSIEAFILCALVLFVYKLIRVPVHTTEAIMRKNQKIIAIKQKRIEQLEEKIRPKLSIMFEQNNNTYYQDDSRLRAVKLAIYNLSAQTIKNIEIKITKVEPMPNNLNSPLPLPLRITHDNPPLIKEFDLNPHSEKFIDVVRQYHHNQSDAPSNSNQTNFEITHSISDIRVFIEPDDYKITIKITANNMLPIQKDFNIGLRNNDNTKDKLWMWSV